MDKPELTPWFDGDVQPVRKGVYEREFDIGIVFAKWDGGWFCAYREADRAARETFHSIRQSLPWRGLASDPRAAK